MAFERPPSLSPFCHGTSSLCSVALGEQRKDIPLHGSVKNCCATVRSLKRA
ncbi:MAG TPA: hypothetical protein PK926_13425 [Spirochaetota bacterium]|nr:hypothetical protein [Spirochaetota bacterium]HPI90303.1 hypothetical protein [Spirochaetota bacterium]HPR49307.1 hypothetical protein [Spirochaetota bacterium]